LELIRLALLNSAKGYDRIITNQVFNAQNRARADPVSFAQELLDFGDFTGADLVRQAPYLPHFTYNGGLRRAAADIIGGSTSNIRTRIEKYGSWSVSIGEGSVAGPNTDIGVISSMINSPPNYAVSLLRLMHAEYFQS
jgi:hypothetical protein